MKTLILTTLMAAVSFTFAMPLQAAAPSGSAVLADDASQGDVEKRRKPRVPGGSGCDDPGDIIEHPECR